MSLPCLKPFSWTPLHCINQSGWQTHFHNLCANFPSSFSLFPRNSLFKLNQITWNFQNGLSSLIFRTLWPLLMWHYNVGNIYLASTPVPGTELLKPLQFGLWWRGEDTGAYTNELTLKRAWRASSQRFSSLTRGSELSVPPWTPERGAGDWVN